jgi:hypothetical protein
MTNSEAKNDAVKQASLKAGFEDWTGLTAAQVRNRVDASKQLAMERLNRNPERRKCQARVRDTKP